MATRRGFIGALGASATVAGLPPALQGCSSGPAAETYEQAAARTWRHGSPDGLGGATLVAELVRYATLAPSSHNTQCWQFHPAPEAITILPDLTRRCPAVDPDDHHLFVSLGCATENLVLAAAAGGWRAEAGFDASREAVQVGLEPAAAFESPLFKAIPDRQCTRGPYDGRPLAVSELQLLERAARSDEVDLLLLTDRVMLEQVLEFVVAGNSAQIADPAFVAELKAWIRFNEAAAVRSGDGLYSASSGNPTAPTWIGRRMFDLFFTADAENDKCAGQVRSSAGIAVFVGRTADRANWIDVGRSYQRFALQASALGIRNAMLNQPVEVAHLRPQFADLLGIGTRRPDLVVRFGRGPKLPVSLRRPVDAVII
jgi:hypothetical protein